MTTPTAVNSLPYRNGRFANDWVAAGGAEQSRYFMGLLVEALPRWLCDEIRHERLRVCDWGCAEGDGTGWLAQALGWDVTGVDFSELAVAHARQRHPETPFLCENWLEHAPREAFDVVVSSNTFEHFDCPWEAFKVVAEQAKRYVLLLVPYREYQRHVEHAATFDDASIMLAPSASWALLQSRVIDAAHRTPSYWQGEQVLLWYARVELLVQRGFSLADVQAHPAAAAERGDAALRALVRREEALVHQSREQQRRIAALLADNREQGLALAATRERLDAVLASTSWRVTEPLRAAGGLRLRALRRWHDVGTAYRRGGAREVAARVAAVLTRRLRAVARALLRRLVPAEPLVSAPGAPSWPLAPARAGFVDVYLFGVIDWNFRVQRPQHLARELARRGHRVFYLTNHFHDDAAAGCDVEALDVELPLYQVRLKVDGAPPIYFDAPSDAARRQIDAALRRFAARASDERAICLVQHPFWARSACALQPACLVYDCIDDHEGFGKVGRKLVDLEHWIMRRADLVVATSTLLAQRAGRHNRHVALVRNAGQYEHFARPPAQRFADPAGRRIVGYYGAIAEWFDVDLVRRVAVDLPEVLVLLVGSDTVGACAALRDLPNVQCVGEVPYVELGHYLHAFDVCLLPFKVTPLTLATNPVKVYEYLAAGRPVVGVALPEMSQFGDLVRTAAEPAGFVAELRAALAEAPDHATDHAAGQPAPAARRQAFAAGQTWAHRADELLAAIAAAAKPRVSVVVLTYGNLALTRECLASVDACREGIDLEMIVVDNASTDGTPEFLRAWAAERRDVRLILNDANLGFAAGNNAGLAAASGDYLVILNNDTVVTPWWAWKLVGHLRNEASLGLVGPLTNRIGNEARVDTHYRGLAQMPAEAERITAPNCGRWFEMRAAAFFCVMMPRSTFERCGPLCEDYGLGMFEDDDYCRRVQREGLRVGCAEDVFVHHEHSVAFNALGDARKRALFEGNRKLYESKWGPWVPHQHRELAPQRAQRTAAGTRR